MRVDFPPTGSWTTWRTVSVPLQLGTNADSLYLVTTGSNGPNLDAVTFRREGAATLTGEPQAEKATVSGVQVVTGSARGSDGGYADYNDAGAYIEWVLESSAHQLRDVSWRYANGSGSARSLQLTVDGGPIRTVLFGPTGSWSTWKTVTTELNLDAGTHRIRLTSVDGSGPNIDFMRVEPLADQA
jgi:hypothetical protein